jgi:hypothetical protein
LQRSGLMRKCVRQASCMVTGWFNTTYRIGISQSPGIYLYAPSVTVFSCSWHLSFVVTPAGDLTSSVTDPSMISPQRGGYPVNTAFNTYTVNVLNGLLAQSGWTCPVLRYNDSVQVDTCTSIVATATTIRCSMPGLSVGVYYLNCSDGATGLTLNPRNASYVVYGTCLLAGLC